MVAAVNSKRRKFDPLKYMMNGAELRRRAREAAERELPSGDELLTKIRRLGVRVIDNRGKS
jgi:hypothetical protein